MIVVMASKTSIYLEAICNAFETNDLFVICDRTSSQVVDFVVANDISHAIYPYRGQTSSEREKYNTALGISVMELKPQLVVLAGWLKLLSQNFLGRLPEKTVLNVHAAILPTVIDQDEVILPDGSISPVFRGLKSVEMALKARVSYIGSTVHWVTSEVDRGEIIKQIKLKVGDFTTEDNLRSELLKQELRMLIDAIKSTIFQHEGNLGGNRIKL